MRGTRALSNPPGLKVLIFSRRNRGWPGEACELCGGRFRCCRALFDRRFGVGTNNEPRFGGDVCIFVHHCKTGIRGRVNPQQHPSENHSASPLLDPGPFSDPKKPEPRIMYVFRGGLDGGCQIGVVAHRSGVRSIPCRGSRATKNSPLRGRHRDLSHLPKRAWVTRTVAWFIFRLWCMRYAMNATAFRTGRTAKKRPFLSEKMAATAAPPFIQKTALSYAISVWLMCSESDYTCAEPDTAQVSSQYLIKKETFNISTCQNMRTDAFNPSAATHVSLTRSRGDRPSATEKKNRHGNVTLRRRRALQRRRHPPFFTVHPLLRLQGAPGSTFNGRRRRFVRERFTCGEMRKDLGWETRSKALTEKAQGISPCNHFFPLFRLRFPARTRNGKSVVLTPAWNMSKPFSFPFIVFLPDGGRASEPYLGRRFLIINSPPGEVNRKSFDGEINFKAEGRKRLSLRDLFFRPPAAFYQVLQT